MTAQDFDVIVVGARCAGAPTALLLARAGCKVLLVDRATFPSDTLSTHVVHPHGVARLASWGVLDRVVQSGCPPIHTYAFHFGPLTLAGSPGTSASAVAYCPRRTVLDQALVDAAVEAGVEFWDAFAVDEVLVDDGCVTGIRGRRKQGAPITAKAPLVVGADGRHSIVAKTMSPEVYAERPSLQGAYYAYWSGLPMEGRFETYIGQGCGFAAAPTNDDLTMVVGGWPLAMYETKRHDHERSYLSLFEQAPAFRERIRHARIESKIFGGTTPNFFRKPFGPGWALVGDAGFIEDPITAQGISNAFLDAELLVNAVGVWRSGERSYHDAMSSYQSARDFRNLPMYDFTCQLAAMEPPPAELVRLLGAVAGDQAAMDQFCRLNAGIVSPTEFFAPDNVQRLLGNAA